MASTLKVDQIEGQSGSTLTIPSGQTLDISNATVSLPTPVVTLTGSQILTNKTIDLTDNTVTGTTAEFNTALSDDSFATLAGTEILTNKTLTSPVINTATSTSPKIVTNILDSGGNELFVLTATGSAVNEFTIANAATGDGPTVSATGGDTNVDLNISPKGIGRVVLGAGKIEQLAEKVTSEATAATGTVNYDVITQAVWNFTTDASANWTLNVRGDASNSLNSIMDTGESITIAHIVSQGATAYYNNAFEIDGSSVTPEWQGGTAPGSGNVSSLDTYSYTIIKTADATFTVLGSQTQFA